MALRNCKYLLSSIAQEDFDYLIFSWVLPSDRLIEELIMSVPGHNIEPFVFSLVCDEASLHCRISHDPDKHRDVGIALERLGQVRSLALATQINTTDMDCPAIAQEIRNMIIK